MMHTLGNPAPAGTSLIVSGPSVRTVARQQGIDLGQLLLILSHRRPEGSETEEKFVEQFLDPIEGMQKDGFGNRYIRIGTAPVMWSCHTDTVSDEGGMQNIKWQGDTLALNEPKRGQSLGADDGAGLWLLLEMLKAGREGLYIFHREEEIGGIGSKWIAKNTPELIDGITMAIAFDRKGTGSVITRQRGRRSCSDKFGSDLAAELNKTEGLDYKLDPTGVFTDTASYTELIAECTNVSVGYYNEHGERETLDVAHLLRLREALLKIDVNVLAIERDPTEVEPSWTNYGNRSWGSNNWGVHSNDPVDEIHQVVKERGYSIARMLHNMGLSRSMLNQMISNMWHRDSASRKDEWQGTLAEYYRDRPHLLDAKDDEEEVEEQTHYEDMLFCNQCQDFDTTNGQLGAPRDGDYCGYCAQNDTEVMEVEVNSTTGELVE